MSNTDGEDTQKVSLGELLLNAGYEIFAKNKELASLRKQIKENENWIVKTQQRISRLSAKLGK